VRASALLIILALALITRAFTAQFMLARLSDPQFFQPGTYAGFAAQAENALDGKTPYFWLDEGDAKESVQQCPGFSLWVAFIYKVSGERSARVVQRVQWVLDAFSVLLVFGIGLTAFGWRSGLIAGLLASLSPMLVLYGTWPLADAPASWLVLGGVWMLLLSWKRESWRWALGAGLMLGASCWMRANALLLPLWCLPVLVLLARRKWRMIVPLCAALALGVALSIMPIVIRNARAIGAFIPVRLGVGTLLWEGIGETERGAEFGAVASDDAVVEQERLEMKLAPDVPLGLFWPDGVRRDRERSHKALAVIVRHPVWFTGVMLGRMQGMLDYTGYDSSTYGPSGFNVTTALPQIKPSAPLTLLVRFLGVLQSALASLNLVLIAGGIMLALYKDWRSSFLLLTIAIYYLVMNSIMHVEHRYNLPMHALLLVFAGFGLYRLIEILAELARKRRAPKTTPVTDGGEGVSATSGRAG